MGSGIIMSSLFINAAIIGKVRTSFYSRAHRYHLVADENTIWNLDISEIIVVLDDW